MNNRIEILVNLFNKISQDSISNSEELLNLMNTKKITKRLYKLKKHYPIFYGISVDKILTEKRNKSISLLTNSVDEQIEFVKDTIKMRANIFKTFKDLEMLAFYKLRGFDIITPVSLRNNILKYEDEQIRKEFPDFIGKNGRLMFNKVFEIKTENYISYIKLPEKVYCNTVLICFTEEDDQYHILYYLDSKKDTIYLCNFSKLSDLHITKSIKQKYKIY